MNVLDFIRKNRDAVLIGAGVIFVTAFGIFVFGKQLGGGSGPAYQNLLQNSGSSSESMSVVFDGEIEDGGSSSVAVYNVEVMGPSDARLISEKLGFSTARENISDDGLYYSWVIGEDFARYNTETGDFVVNSQPMVLSEIQRGYVTEETIEDYFKEFVETYLGYPTEMYITSEFRGEQFEVEASLTIDGYEVVRYPGQEYAIKVNFTEGGDLTALYVSLHEFSKASEKVDVVSIEELQAYIDTYDYPTEAYIGFSYEQEEDCDDCDPYGWYLSDELESADIKEVRLIYYYDISETSDVLPVYRLSGTGVVLKESGDTREEGVIIYANAVDPSQIIIPESE